MNAPDDNAIWSADEVCEIIEDSIVDGRSVPEYEFRYKQAVETTDMYLGLDPMGKNPTSTTCEDLVLLVTLPDAQTVASIDVNLTSTAVTVLTIGQYAPQTMELSKKMSTLNMC